jgi:hypothetical protein
MTRSGFEIPSWRRWSAAAAGLLLAASACACAQGRPERSLAGIVIGRPASQIFAKYGNPTRVQVGQFTPEATQTPGMPGAEGTQPGGFNFPSPTSVGLPPSPTGGGLEAPPPAMGGGMPGPTSLGGALGGTSLANLASSLFGGAMTGPTPTPGMGMPGAFGGAPGMPQGPQLPRRAITKYFYDYASGPSLVFTVGYKGLVEQIDAFAPWPWSPARTSRGINVGATYAQVIAKYGFPDSQRQNPDGTLVMDYSEKASCAFTLLNGKVVGVSVALVE